MKALLSAAMCLVAMPLLGGCVARAVVDVVTAPVRLVGEAADLATTSQSEADEKRGRELRKREERLGKLERSYARHRRQCDRGDRDACKDARDDYEEIKAILPTLPAEYRY